MSIFSVAVSLRSISRSLEELNTLTGAEPSRSHSLADRISLRMPADKVRKDSYWSKESGVREDTWTLAPHWPTIAPVLEAIAIGDTTGIETQLSIGTNARHSDFSFHIEPEQLELLVRAGCGVWIDSYPPNRDLSDRPDDYRFPEGGTFHSARGLGRVRRRVNSTLRNLNPFGKVLRRRVKAPLSSNA